MPGLPNREAGEVRLGTVRGAHAEPEVDYEIYAPTQDLVRVMPGQITSTVVVVHNVSDNPWQIDKLLLEAVYPTGDGMRVSKWADATWTTPSQVSPNSLTAGVATFTFNMVAPNYPGLYKESFRLSVSTGEMLAGETIDLLFEVEGAPSVQSIHPKEIRIYRSSQSAALIEDGFIVAETLVSTGKAGYTTPAGNYYVMNRFPEAQSQAYKLWMSNWMGLVREGKSFEGYGMHSLAYWRTASKNYVNGEVYNGRLYQNGKLYEDFDHLGTPMSHGCIRFGIYESGVVYSWVYEGMPVIVV